MNETDSPEARKGLRGSVRTWLCLVLLLLPGACRDGRRTRIVQAAGDLKALEGSVMEALSKDGDSGRSFQELAPEYARVMKPLLTGSWEDECDDPCMATSFAAVSAVAGYSHGQDDPEIPDTMVKMYRRLKFDGLSTMAQARAIRAALIKHRRFEEAGRFSASEGVTGEAIPPLVVPSFLPKRHRVISYSPDARSVSISTIGIARQSVILISGPTCEWSKEALDAILADAALRRDLLPRLTILGPPAGTIEAGYYSGWNRLHPRFRQSQAFSVADWPEVADWDRLPTFYFVADGRIVARQVGWGPESVSDLKKNVRAMLAASAR